MTMLNDELGLFKAEENCVSKCDKSGRVGLNKAYIRFFFFHSLLSSFIGLKLQIIAAKCNQTTYGQNLFNCISLNIQHVEKCFEQKL
jgi:hypothetical protein